HPASSRHRAGRLPGCPRLDRRPQRLRGQLAGNDDSSAAPVHLRAGVSMSILESLVARPVPLRTDADGVLRVGNTRVRLETVLSSFANGVSAEEILLKYPSLNLTDIYSVITYYLWHQEEIDA